VGRGAGAHPRVRRDDGPTMTGMIGLVSAPLALIGSLLFESGQREAHADGNPRQLGALAVVFLLGYLLAYSAWYQVLGRFPCRSGDAVHLLMPVAGVDHRRPGRSANM